MDIDQFLKRWQKRLGTSGMDCNKGDNLNIKKLDKDEKTTNELRIEINDSSSTHNNNFAIALKSKNIDVDKLLPMAEQWITDHKQKAWLEKK